MKWEQYDGDLIKLNGKSFSCIKKYGIQRNKLWGKDTGRNMAGDFKGSFIGVYPKIKLEIAPTDAEEMRELSLILDSASITVEYYNNKYGCTCTANFTANDYDESLYTSTYPDLIYEAFEVHLTPERREDRHVKNN